MSVRVVPAALLLAACSQSVPASDDEGAVPAPVSLARCAPAAAPRDFGVLAEQARSVVGFSPCGDLAWLGEARDLYRAPPDLGSVLHVSETATDSAFSADGRWLGFADDAGVVLVPLDGGETLRAPLALPRGFGFARVDDTVLPWACDDDALRVLDAGAPRALVEGVDCRSLRPDPASALLVFLDAGGALKAANVGDGVVRDLGGLEGTAPDSGRQDVRGTRLMDRLPGDLLIVRDSYREPCGDTECPTGPAPVWAIDVGTGAVLTSLSGPLLDDWSEDLMTSRDGRAVVLDVYQGGATLVDAAHASHGLPGVVPAFVFGDGREVLARRRAEGERSSGFAMVSTTDAAARPLVDHAEAFGVSADERRLALAHFTPDCILYPDRPGVCHTQIWALATATRGAGEAPRDVAWFDQPPRVYWIGDDGTMLVGGELYTRPVPEAAAPEEGRPDVYGLMLLAPDGTLRAALGDESWLQVQAAGERLLLTRRDGQTLSVDVLDPATGAVAAVVSGQEVELSVADDGLRMAALADGTLWAGAVPTP